MLMQHRARGTDIRIYLAGPMRGLKAFNFPAFHDAQRKLLAAGHDVFNPAAYDESRGFDATPFDGTEDLTGIGFSLRDALGADLAWISRHAEGVATLPGFMGSKGARAEVATAEALGLPVASVEYWVEDGATPWRDGFYSAADSALVRDMQTALDLVTEPYRPAIGDRVRIVDADYMDIAIRESDTTVALIGLVADLGCDVTYDATGDKRLHPIKVTLDDEGQQWHAVTVELIETAAEIAEYEAAAVQWANVPRDIEAEADRILEALDLETAKVNSSLWTEHFAFDEDPMPDGPYAIDESDADEEAFWHDFEREIESDNAIEELRERLTGEVRVTSATGGQKGSKIHRYDLIPTGPLAELAEHYGKGAAKYERVNGLDNWRNGYNWSLSYAALQRHANAFWNGEDIDPENGSKHIIAAAWHCLSLAHFMEQDGFREMFDDRQDRSVIV